MTAPPIRFAEQSTGPHRCVILTQSVSKLLRTNDSFEKGKMPSPIRLDERFTKLHHPYSMVTKLLHAKGSFEKGVIPPPIRLDERSTELHHPYSIVSKLLHAKGSF